MAKQHKNEFTDPEIIKQIERFENSPAMQEKLRAVKREMRNKAVHPLSAKILLFMIVAVGLASGKTYIFMLACVAFFFLSKYFDERKTDVDSAYINHFLVPMLNAICPGTKVHYFDGMDTAVLERFLPGSARYESNCHILFADDCRTEFANMTSFHYERGEKEESVTITDFVGQILMIKLPTGISGHIRIVPVLDESWTGSSLHGRYGGKKDDEKDIRTESIEFNRNYSVFSTDDFYTRLILDPNVIDILNHWRQRMRICVYMNEEYIAVAFRSNRFLFSPPSTETEADHLSMAGEYDKVRVMLSDFYVLIDLIREKLIKEQRS